MKKVISDEIWAELAALANLTDEQIDTSDIPEQRDWKGAKRGLFYRPSKQQLTLRIDTDIIAGFKARVAGVTQTADSRSPAGDRSVGRSLDTQTIGLWMHDYCQSHTLDMMAAVAEALRVDFERHEATNP
jgi:uncharacterized protein (DUF4415 family)